MTADDDFRAMRGIITGVTVGALLWAVLGGCAITALRVYHNGPATFITGEPGAVRDYCTKALSKVKDNRGAAAGKARGCSTWAPADNPTQVTIACPEGDDDCVAHELRHVIQPEWRH